MNLYRLMVIAKYKIKEVSKILEGQNEFQILINHDYYEYNKINHYPIIFIKF